MLAEELDDNIINLPLRHTAWETDPIPKRSSLCNNELFIVSARI
jgi:hypothetical protein